MAKRIIAGSNPPVTPSKAGTSDPRKTVLTPAPAEVTGWLGITDVDAGTLMLGQTLDEIQEAVGNWCEELGFASQREGLLLDLAGEHNGGPNSPQDENVDACIAAARQQFNIVDGLACKLAAACEALLIRVQRAEGGAA